MLNSRHVKIYFVQHFLPLGLLFVLLLATLLWLPFRTQAETTLAGMQANERQSLQLGGRAIDAVLGVLHGDALYLAEISSLQQWLDTDDPATQSHLATDFLAFARHRQLYDQVRFLDEHGQEMVRINLNEGQPMVMPNERLVSHVSPSIIAASMAEYTRNLGIALVVLILLLILLGAVIAHFAVRRRQAENAVRASEARFRGLLESAPDAIVIVNRYGHITLINSQTEKWFGYTRNDLIGQSVEQLIPERLRKEHLIAREQYLVEAGTRPTRARLELYGRRKGGSEFPIEISLSPLETDQGLLITGIIRDISMRKQTEEAQRRVQTRYRDLINNLPVGVFRNQPGTKGKFLEVNPAMVDIFEAESIEQLLLHPFSESYCDLADRKAFIDKVTCQGYAKAEEMRLRTLQGREFYAALTAVMKKDAAGEIYFDGIVEDISARKESERQIRQLNDSLQARSRELETINHELEAFSYSVSHDLRAPLRAMDGFSRTLLDQYADRLDDKARDRLHRIRAAAQRMAELIDDLLKLSRVSRIELKWELVDLTQLANEVFRMLLLQMESERTLKISVQPGLIARGDAQLLRIMLDNLLSNAWKFTARCQVASIEVGGKVEGEKFIYFVRDNGAGFDMAFADKLFGVFQRLHDANEFPGTGIGLATVQRVIHKHGGHIWTKSAVNQGTTFYFTLMSRCPYE